MPDIFGFGEVEFDVGHFGFGEVEFDVDHFGFGVPQPGNAAVFNLVAPAFNVNLQHAAANTMNNLFAVGVPGLQLGGLPGLNDNPDEAGAIDVNMDDLDFMDDDSDEDVLLSGVGW
ncbi:hypothetical protein OF83DRAFT_1180740 [Amylostereum chailletii]|nr:hypothetical protein OF83DRAFT_1180740 [Amylostereum chailletii]